jgi:hypothetical protein
MMRKLHCHKLVAETAKEMAAAVYEELAKRNEWYALNPSQKAFVEATYGSLIEQARQVLANMLASNSVPLEQKEAIFEALVLDKTLKFGRGIRNRVVTIC